jgi:hypothetical protein
MRVAGPRPAQPSDSIRRVEAATRALILDSLERQLSSDPTLETRNRKRLRPNPIAPWELRIGRLRVYFDVEDEPRPLVRILAVGVKDRDRVSIGGEEVELK